MLNNEVRQRLQQLISHYGHSVCDNTKRCEALMRDFCPEHKRELNLLILALREGTPQHLLKPTPHVSMDFTIKRLAQSLHDNLGIAESFAFWAVETWALSLQVIQLPIAQTTQAQIVQHSATKPQTAKPTKSKTDWWQQKTKQVVTKKVQQVATTQLYAQIAATLPAPPTDSSLRRHYDAMVEEKVKKLLNK